MRCQSKVESTLGRKGWRRSRQNGERANSGSYGWVWRRATRPNDAARRQATRPMRREAAWRRSTRPVRREATPGDEARASQGGAARGDCDARWRGAGRRRREAAPIGRAGAAPLVVIARMGKGSSPTRLLVSPRRAPRGSCRAFSSPRGLGLRPMPWNKVKYTKNEGRFDKNNSNAAAAKTRVAFLPQLQGVKHGGCSNSFRL
ncbi:hypothetical protein GUJ93_ZPchr0002g26314 [Zizania palustris]|uniref:Uncharacterized protein n=1 Tax=Zizania palustris TaxID=103762 RepID=A0A8J5S7X9_ZIZPA|nr:hypothetical protein GUJ93_ZPchr0002g26314 [Zizania palustris]